MTGLKRVATKAAMNKALRTEARPPQMVRRPLRVPLSRGKGATPTRADICLRPRVPSSGSSASIVRLLTGPMLGGGAENFLVLFPQRVFLDETVEVLIGVIEFLFEIRDMSGDTFFDRFRGRGQVVFLSDDHVDELSSAHSQSSEFKGKLVGQRARLGTNRFSVVSQDRRINAIGFSQLSSGLGEVSDLAWVSHDHRDLGADQAVHDLTFKSSGRFQDNQGWPKLLEVLDQGLDASFIVRHRHDLCGGADSDIELGFRDIDADKDEGSFQNVILLTDCDQLQPSSALQVMRAWITQATVRASGEQRRDDPCYATVSNDRGACGLSRPFRINIFS